jgi:hypothetical protein
MAYTTIDDPSAYFQTTLYTGQSSGFSITNGGNSDLKPDWIWIKRRDGSADHNSFDSSRGTGAHLAQNQTQAEQTVNGVTAFNSDGFTLSTNNDSNYDGGTFVAWQWKANGGTTASNTDGNITSTVQANTTAGFSIVTWTGNETSSASVGHGLGVTPDLVIFKNRSSAYNWVVYLGALGQTSGNNMFAYLNLTNAAEQGAGITFTSSLLNPGSGATTNASSMIAYCFNSVQGYSKFGTYVGNGTSGTDGTFIYTGFKPAMIMTKRASSADAWVIYDNKRDPDNPCVLALAPNSNAADDTFANWDFVSNGFKSITGNSQGASGVTFVYWAFAETPFVTSTGIPTTAR